MKQQSGELMLRKSGFLQEIIFGNDAKMRRSSKICLFEVSLVEYRSRKIRIGEVAFRKICLGEIGFSKHAMLEKCFAKVFFIKYSVRKIGFFKTETKSEIVCLFKINSGHFTADEFHFAECGIFNFHKT